MTGKWVSICVTVLLLPILSGCVNDAASFQIDGKEHSLSLVREQKWIWESQVDLFVVVTRMPECQRRHRLRNAAINASAVEVYSPDAMTFFLRQGGRTYSVESRTCEGFRELPEAQAGGLGLKLGVFRESKGAFIFVEEPAFSGGVEGKTPGVGK